MKNAPVRSAEHTWKNRRRSNLELQITSYELRIFSKYFKIIGECMKDNIIVSKSFHFAIRIINFYKYLKKEKKETELAKQILRSGTSIGANIEEAVGGQSKKDFLNKISIAYKEARETHYWLRLLYETKFINKDEFDSILNDCEELLKILGSIQISTKKNLE
jgi:four helix bundle protein